MKTILLSVIGLGLISISSLTLATNGYSPHGFGTRSKGMAGVSAALPLDSLSSATNPALMPHVGHRLDLGLSLFSPHRSYTAEANGSPVGPPMGPPTIVPGSYESDKNYFFVPHVAYNYMLNDKSSIGLAISGNGGMNTEYPTATFAPFNNPGGQASQPTGVDLGQVFIGVPYGFKLNEQHSIGFMPILTVQWFEAYGLEPFKPFSHAPNQLTNHGHDLSYGGGFRLGWYGQLNPRFALGLSYQTRLYMTEFDDYSGLFAEQGDFDVPPTITLGAAFHARSDLTVALDVQHIWYSDVNAIGNRADLVFMPGGEPLLGTDNGLGFGWDDATIIKLGGEWHYQPDLILRAGYSRSTQVIPATQALFNILAPATVRQHFTLGLTKILNSLGSELNAALMYAPNEKINGSNPNTGPQTGHIQMRQFEFELSWGWRF